MHRLSSSLLGACLLTASIGSALALDTYPARPIGWNARSTAGYNEQDDFQLLHGPVRGQQVLKLFFTTRVKALAGGAEQRAVYVQALQPHNNFTNRIHLFSEREGSPVRIGTYVLGAGKQIDNFLFNDDVGFPQNPRLRHYERIFYHVPGKGLYNTEGGAPAKLIRPESFFNPIVGGIIRLNEYIFDHKAPDTDLQARLFFGAGDAKKGREPFISAGSAGSTKLLQDVIGGKGGCDPEQFVALGPQNNSQQVYFVGRASAGGPYQIYRIQATTSGNFITSYQVVPFFQPPGKPENMIANGFEMFFTAPAVAGGVPELWHVKDNNSQPELVSNTGLDPKDLHFTLKDDSYSELVMTVLDKGVRRYGSFVDPIIETGFVEILDTVADDPAPSSNPYAITDAGQSFFFAATYDPNGQTYLIKHYFSDNELQTVTLPGGVFPTNIGEVAYVSSDGRAGVVYFTADATINGVPVSRALFKREANPSTEPIDAEPVFTPSGKPVIGAHNLRGLADDAGVVGRLYFTAPINSTTNAEFLTGGLSDLGTKPFVTEP